MGNIGITIANTVILLVFLACAGNLIVGGLLNAIRESKGKTKKKRTSLIIFDIAMMAVCFFAFQIVSGVAYSEPEAEAEPKTWYALWVARDDNGSVSPFHVFKTYDSPEACVSGLREAHIVTVQQFGVWADKVGCYADCAEPMVDLSTCADSRSL